MGIDHWDKQITCFVDAPLLFRNSFYECSGDSEVRWKLTEAGLVASLRQYLMVKTVLFYIIPKE